MSILVQKSTKFSGPRLVPGNVSNVSINAGIGKASIKWTDPDDTAYGDFIFIKWKGTILVRKKDSAPSNVNDGDILINSTIKNQYKDIVYEDNNLSDGNYYYRFFVYSEDKVFNTDESMIYNISIVNVDPILKNNTWEQIANASESGNIPSTWKIGDEIDLVLKGNFNESVTLQIWDFNHFDKSDGSGKVGICFGMKHLMKDNQQMNRSDTNSGGWNNSQMKNTTMNNVFNSLPIELRDHIKEVKTEANKGGYNSSSQACTDKVFLPGFKEVGGNWDNYDGNQKQFPIFTNDASRIKKMNNGSGYANWWWTRSPRYSYSLYVCYVSDSGGITSGDANTNNGVCFCFNV